MDLNTDCQYLILDQLRVTDLSALEKVNKYFECFAGDIVRRRFAKKMVVFDLLWPHDIPYDYVETAEYIEMKHAETTIKMLKQFGRYIQNLKIQHISTERHLDREPTKEVYKLIQELCSETLTQFHLKHVQLNYFENVTKVFKNVQNVTLEGNLINLGNDRLNLSEMFPAMRSLRVNMIQLQNRSTLILKFPQLEHLHVDIYSTDFRTYVTEPIIVELVKENPQIQSIVIGNLCMNLLQVVAENLINLEQLSLHNYYEVDSNATFHFEHVNSFKISNDRMQNMPTTITFGEQLEEFEANAQLTSLNHKYVTMIENNRNLKRISINGPNGLDNEDVQRLASANLNVVDLSIVCDIRVREENLVQLVKNCRELNRFHLKMTWTAVDRPSMSTIEGIATAIQREIGSKLTFEYYEIILSI